MKSKDFLLSVFLLIATVSSFAQELKYTDLATIKTSGTYTSYLSKDNITYKIGDQLLVSASSQKGYYYFAVTKGEDYGHITNDLTGTILTITKIYILYKEERRYYVLLKARDSRNVLYSVSLEHGVARREVSLYKQDATTNTDISVATATTQQKANNSSLTTPAQQVNGKYSKAGTIAPDVKIIDCDKMQPFKEGYAVVTKGIAYGIIDTNGNFLVPYGTYSQIPDGFVNGMCRVSNDSRSELCGFVDKTGKLIIPLKHKVQWFSEDGYAYNTIRTYFIDKKGNAFDKTYGSGQSIDKNTGRYIAEDYVKKEYGIYDRTGKLLVSLKGMNAEFSWPNDLDYSLIPASKVNEFGETKWGFIDPSNGKIVIPLQFSNKPGPFVCGLAVVVPADRTEFDYAYIDKTGKVHMKMKHKEQNGFGGLAGINVYDFIFHKNGLAHSPSGFIDTLGNVVYFGKIVNAQLPNIQPNKVGISMFDFGMEYIAFSVWPNTGVIDIKGNIIVPPVFSVIGSKSSLDEGRIIFDSVSKLAYAKFYDKNEKLIEGYINTEGVFVIIKGEASKW